MWNKAGTWEERVHTPWAIERLKQLIEAVAVPVDDTVCGGTGRISIKKSVVTGDAQVTMARGKVKHIYDFSATVDFVVDMDSADKDITGTLQIEDISGDREYEFQTTTVRAPPPFLIIDISLQYL